MSIKNKYLTVILLWAGVAGCKQVPMIPGLGPYKIDIQQGNAVTQEMVAKLQAGMTRNQVRFALGTPLLVDPFRADRWDYFYSYSKRGEITEQRKLVVYFKDDKLDRVEGDVIPAKPAPAAPALKPDAGKPPLSKPVEVKAAAKPAPTEAAAAPTAATLTTSDGTPVGVGAAAEKQVEKPAAAKPEPSQPKAEEHPKEERGFFGRMLEKIGL